MNDCMAYGQVTAPSQQNPTSAPTEFDVVYDTVWHTINKAVDLCMIIIISYS